MRHEASGGWHSSAGSPDWDGGACCGPAPGSPRGCWSAGNSARHELSRFGKRAHPRVGGRWVEAEGFRLAQRADPAQFIAFTADFPFYALAPSWSGEGDPGGSVELLWSADGVTWSEPIWIGRASHSGRPDRDGRTIGSLVSTPGASFSNTGPTTAPVTSRRCRGSRSTTSTPPRGRRWSRSRTRRSLPSSLRRR